MRIFIPSMTDFFTFMDHKNFSYVFLRGIESFENGFPAWGSKKDVDLLVDDRAIEELYAQYGAIKKTKGVKCDIYSPSGHLDSGYLGFPYFPERLAHEMLNSRRMHKDKFYVPSAKARLKSLIYSVTYHKGSVSKIHINDATQSSKSKYIPELSRLMDQTNIQIPFTLIDFHKYLQSENLAISYDRLVAYVQNDFKHHRKDHFFARIMHDMVDGEMNLYFIRKTTVKNGRTEQFLNHLREHFEIVYQKNVPFWTRLLKMKHIRGNKWRRGGKPYIAVVVYDHNPTPLSEEEKTNQPHVLNRNQFNKQQWRLDFVENNPVKKSANPIHSTDNEAEAVGHFPLLFDASEQAKVFSRLKEIRDAKN